MVQAEGISIGRSLSRRRSFQLGVIDRDDRGWTILHIGARKEDVEEVKRLLDEGMDVNAITWGQKSEGATPLHLAAEGGHLKVMDVLLEAVPTSMPGPKFISSFCRCSNVGTPLHSAVKERRWEAVKFLIENGAFLPDDINDCRFCHD